MAIATGTRNLILLGLGATIITIITTGISLKIYHDSGDIYLDRSRPGYLPEQAEAASEENLRYKFPETGGPVTPADLEEYLKRFNEATKTIEDLQDPYSADPLSDKSLGIPTTVPEPSPAV